MKIELKNVKTAHFASRETECFEASVYIDGKLAGSTSNDGNGGPNSYHPWSLMTVLNEYGKTLPPYKSQWGDIEISADILIGDALNEYETRRNYRRLCKKGFVYTVGTDIYSSKADPTKVQAVVKNPDFVAAFLKQKKADALLNAMPEDEAVSLMIKLAA